MDDLKLQRHSISSGDQPAKESELGWLHAQLTLSAIMVVV